MNVFVRGIKSDRRPIRRDGAGQIPVRTQHHAKKLLIVQGRWSDPDRLTQLSDRTGSIVSHPE